MTMQQYGPRDVPPTRPNHDPVTYEVTGQTYTYGTGPDGRPTPGYDVAFTTSSGLPGSVFVPIGRYTVDNVRAAIVGHAQHIEAVAKLTS